MKKTLLFNATILCTATLFAAQPQYKVIIDAGDTVSRLHIFQIEPAEPLPIVKDIFTENNATALASFSDNPPLAGLSFKKILDDAQQKLIQLGVNPATVAINVMGTDAMRMLSETKQRNLYAQVMQFIQAHYPFAIEKNESLSVATQSIYEWLDANYLAANFAAGMKTVGVLKIANQSAALAYETADASRATARMTINHQTHYIVSEPYSMLGENAMRDEMSHHALAHNCYPLNFPLSPIAGNFNLPRCRGIYAGLVEQYRVTKPLREKFVVFANGYRSYDFLGAEIPDQDSFEARLNYVCLLPWELMKKEYEGMSEQELSVKCANAVWVDQFIYGTLQLKEEQIWPAARINRMEIDWPLGMVLYQLFDE